MNAAASVRRVKLRPVCVLGGRDAKEFVGVNRLGFELPVTAKERRHPRDRRAVQFEDLKQTGAAALKDPLQRFGMISQQPSGLRQHRPTG